MEMMVTMSFASLQRGPMSHLPKDVQDQMPTVQTTGLA
jgi:hypothetical protein